VNGKVVVKDSKPIQVDRYVRRDQRNSSKCMFNNLYVKQFPREDFTSEDLAVRDFEFTM